MVKAYVLLLFLLSCNMTIGKKISVEYDERNDLIVKDGKIYLPINEGSLNSGRLLSSTSEESATGTNVSNEHKPAIHCETEEELSSGKFWFYIFFIGCKYL
jgi:hypothetical protein